MQFGLNNTNVLSDSSGGKKYEMDLIRLKSRCQKGFILLGDVGGRGGNPLSFLIQLKQLRIICISGKTVDSSTNERYY